MNLFITAAWAAGGAAPTDSIVTVMFLLAVVSGAYVLAHLVVERRQRAERVVSGQEKVNHGARRGPAHLVVERLQRSYLFVSGLEYVILGAVLGPALVPAIRPFADLQALGPVFAFAAGWIGLLYGMELNLAQLLARADRCLRIAIVDAVVTGGGSAAAAYAFFTWDALFPHAVPEDVMPAALTLGCAAAATSTSAVDLVRSRYPTLTSDLLPLLSRSAKLGDLFAITVFGLVFCVVHPSPTLIGRDVVWAEWLLITAALGLALGAVFMSFLSDREGDNEVFLAMVGILLFASGASFFLELSALLVNLILGLVIVQTAKGLRVHAQLERTAKPVRLVLMLFAGALWTPVDPAHAALAIAGYIALRVVAKTASGWIATVGTGLRGDLFRGSLAQGDVAIAMAISAKLVFHGEATELAYTAILVSVALHELVAPRLLRGLIVDAGELDDDAPATLPAEGAA